MCILASNAVLIMTFGKFGVGIKYSVDGDFIIGDSSWSMEIFKGLKIGMGFKKVLQESENR